ncbi:MAG: HD domain-containing phosphohydrolase [Candidatus Omnitrophota bacterium]
MVDLHKGFDGFEKLEPSDEEKKKKKKESSEEEKKSSEEEKKPSEERGEFAKEELAPAGERLKPSGREEKEEEKVSLAERAGTKEMLLEPEPESEKSDPEKAEALYSSILKFITPVFDKVKDGKEDQIKGEEILGWAQEFTDRLRGSIIPSDLVRLVFKHDEHEKIYIYTHSVNVCLLSAYIAMSLNFSRGKLLNLVIASLFHDIGMMRIPLHAWNKDGKLSAGEYEEVKKHSLYGEEIFKNLTGIDDEIISMIGQHQERTDGSGYPRGLSKDKIHYGSRLLALVDRYETGTHTRLYKARELPDVAIQQILDNEGSAFDRYFLKVLLRQVSMFPVSTWVIISTGEIGKVVKINENTPMRPVIKIAYDRERRSVTERLLDLSKQLLIHVNRCMDPEELEK